MGMAPWNTVHRINRTPIIGESGQICAGRSQKGAGKTCQAFSPIPGDLWSRPFPQQGEGRGAQAL